MPRHYLNQYRHFINWTHWEQNSVKFEPKYSTFHARNEFENVICKMIAIWSQIQCVNSSLPSAAYMLQWIRTALVPIMAVAYSAPSHYLNQCWVIVRWTLGTNFNEILIKIQNFSFTKMHLKMSSAKRWPLCPGGDELKHTMMTMPIDHSLGHCCQGWPIQSYCFVTFVRDTYVATTF